MSPRQLRKFSAQVHRSSAALFGSSGAQDDGEPNIKILGIEFRAPWSALATSRQFQVEGFSEGAEAVCLLSMEDLSSCGLEQPEVDDELVHIPSGSTYVVMQLRPAAAGPGIIKLVLRKVQ
jgi:hypothetical protein